MAKKATSKKIKAKEGDVVCSECQFSKRDTDGISFNIDTKVFFMGICSEMEGDGKPGRVFMDKKRTCKKFKQIEKQKEEERKTQDIKVSTQMSLF